MTSVKSGVGLDKAQGPTLGDVDTLACVYCRASVHYVGLPATRYVEHLCKFLFNFSAFYIKKDMINNLMIFDLICNLT